MTMRRPRDSIWWARAAERAAARLSCSSPTVTLSSHPDGYLWKRDHLARHSAGAAFAWIDDDFTPADHAWATARTASGHPTLLVQPEHRSGIQPAHLHAVRTWARVSAASGQPGEWPVGSCAGTAPGA